jgi:hypothetical protein
MMNAGLLLSSIPSKDVFELLGELHSSPSPWKAAPGLVLEVTQAGRRGRSAHGKEDAVLGGGG